MNKRTERTTGRYGTINDFAAYSGLGLSAARSVAQKIGIVKKIGRRCIYDLQAFDEYMQTHDSIELTKKPDSAAAEQLISDLQ